MGVVNGGCGGWELCVVGVAVGGVGVVGGAYECGWWWGGYMWCVLVS